MLKKRQDQGHPLLHNAGDDETVCPLSSVGDPPSEWYEALDMPANHKYHVKSMRTHPGRL